ncbi:MAG: LiaI-LiaF-like domain-containing protein [Terriglobia bacterium]
MAPDSASFFRAIRGPILLICLGSLIAMDYAGYYSFSRTWPTLIIVFGLFKLLERIADHPVSSPPSYPPAGGAR